MDLDDLIENHEKVIDLLKEYKESMHYESCTHSIQQYSPGRFMMFEIATRKEIAHGDKATIRKWVSRKTTPEKTYNYKLVIEKTIEND